MPYVLYTEDELRKIHRGFGHPSVRSTYHLLRRASGEDLDKKVKQQLDKISDDCKICLRNAATPRRFRLTVGTDELRFNHRVVVDTMFIQNKPIIHLVDESTHFTAACFLKNQTASEIWNCIRRIWILTYMGPPRLLSGRPGFCIYFKRNQRKYGSRRYSP